MGVNRAGLAARLTAIADRHRHILVVAPAGCRPLRILAEASVTSRGWVVALGPAEADAILVCGSGADPFGRIVDRIWEQLPGPRARGAIGEASEIEAALSRLVEQWSDRDAQSTDAAARGPVDAGAHGEGATDAHAHGEGAMHTHANGADADDAAGGSGAPDAPGGSDAPGASDAVDAHTEHDMDMSGPAGIPLAGGSEADRDRLEMDVLNITLGPVLPSWPDGLVVRGTLSGDVLTHVEAEVIRAIDTEAAGPRSTEPAAGEIVGLLDDMARLLHLSGWNALADRLRHARDQVATGTDPTSIDLAWVRRGIRRSPVLRWSLTRTGSRRLRASIDLSAILEGWMTRLEELTANDPPAPRSAPPRTATLDGIAALLEGLELSDVRLVVAALGLDSELAAGAEVSSA